jgi:hypothetical protein
MPESIGWSFPGQSRKQSGAELPWAVQETESSPADPAAHLVCLSRKSLAATCVATSEEEQAVSMVMAGPLRPNVKERRPEATERATPACNAKKCRALRISIAHVNQGHPLVSLSKPYEECESMRVHDHAHMNG